MNKDVRDLVRELRDKGWNERKCGSGHIKMENPDGFTLIFPSSPSDNRWIKNKRAEIRRIELRREHANTNHQHA